MKKLVALLLAVVLVLGLMTGALAADGELAGKTVILHTNDVHGAIGLYAKVAALKKDYAETVSYTHLTLPTSQQV